MMKILYALLSLFALGVYSSCKPSLQQEGDIKKQGDVYVLSFADCSFSVSAKEGGRVVSFQCGGTELLTSDTIHNMYYGATFWLSPQADYWTQCKSLDALPYTTMVDGNRLRLNAVDTINALSVTKEFAIFAADSSVLVDYSVRNISRQPRKMAPWDVVRVYGGLSFFPIDTDEASRINGAMVKGSYEDKGVMWIPNADEMDEKAQKVFSMASEGWLAHRYQNLLFVKCFPNIQIDEVPPGQGEVEVYVAPKGKYIELENHGKYVELQPGQSFTYHQKWFLREVSAKKRSEVTGYIKNMVSRTMREELNGTNL